MIFADRQFYEEEYLLGRPIIIPLPEFLYWSRKASERVNWRKVKLLEIPDELKLCVCEVAEAYYTASQTAGPTTKRSESVGAYSVTYADQKRKQDEIEADIDGIISKWLAGTVLHNDFIFRGG